VERKADLIALGRQPLADPSGPKSCDRIKKRISFFAPIAIPALGRCAPEGRFFAPRTRIWEEKKERGSREKLKNQRRYKRDNQ